MQQNRCLLMVAPEQLLASYDECSHRLGRVGEQMVLARMVAALRACSLEHHQPGELRASDIFPTGCPRSSKVTFVRLRLLLTIG